MIGENARLKDENWRTKGKLDMTAADLAKANQTISIQRSQIDRHVYNEQQLRHDLNRITKQKDATSQIASAWEQKHKKLVILNDRKLAEKDKVIEEARKKHDEL